MKLSANRDSRDIAEAKERAARARVYAQLFPEDIKPYDLKYQTVDWQLAQVRKFNRACCPQKI